MERIVVDPITRIEGHLRIEADFDGNVIKNAVSSGTAVRGLELIVQDRDPRDVWAYVQRICGVCTTVHALASIRAVENALGIEIPRNAQLIRNIMEGTQYMHDHVVHFYHLHALDWVDVVSALSADVDVTSATAQSISDWPNSSPGYFREVQGKVQKLVDSGQLSIFANGYWGHEAYKLSPEVNLLAVAHYLEALDMQKEIVRVHTILGGKNPHPFYTVGGMATPLDINSDNAVNIEQLEHINRIIADTQDFINKVYIPDLKAIGAVYKDWTYGGTSQNYLSFGDFPTGTINEVDSYRFPRGAILNGDLSNVMEVDLMDPDQIKELIDHAWYTYDGEPDGGKHPSVGETTLNYTGPEAPFTNLDENEKYSWIKAPRWKGEPMEVGPLARVVIGYAKGMPEYVGIVDATLKELDLPITALNSALGRTVARGLESVLVANWTVNDMNELIARIKDGDQKTFNNVKWDPSTWDSKANGVGFCEAPRGGLGHWIDIEDGKTKNYQCIVPTTWNASPRDNSGKIAPYEEALAGTEVVDVNQPLEILRIIHSYDPCLACAVHLTDLENKNQTEIKIG